MSADEVHKDLFHSLMSLAEVLIYRGLTCAQCIHTLRSEFRLESYLSRLGFVFGNRMHLSVH
jgi:hypothetical protein